MIVEDDPHTVRYIKKILVDYGYTLTSVASLSEEAIKNATRDRPDLILMDIMLDGEIDGIETARRINERLRVPILYLTAYSDDTLLAKARETLPYGYIIKPFTAIDLHAAILMALYKAKDELLKRSDAEVDENTVKLRKANSLLEELSAHKSRMLSSMSHELRTPLNAIIGYTDLLRTEFYGSVNEKQMNYLETINESGKHLLSLISDLLDISRIDAGVSAIELAQISIRDFITTVTGMFAVQIAQKKIRVSTHVHPSIDFVISDRKVLRQILINLLSNAIKFSEEDSDIEITVTPSEESSVKFEVRDYGIGIKEEDRDKIFSEFYQVDRVRDSELGGTGIGLALTSRLVKSLDGEIGVVSETQKGSAFWVVLPQEPGQDVEVGLDQSVMISARALGNRILVADDNESNLKLIVDILTVHGHEILIAKNGEEVIEKAITDNPELILIDLRMPVMSGLEATKKLRSIPEFKKIPIIALTASADDESIKNCMEAGCTDHIAKPVKIATLVNILDRYLT